jgi:hypothetical protein
MSAPHKGRDGREESRTSDPKQAQKLGRIRRLTRELVTTLMAEYGPTEAARLLEQEAAQLKAAAGRRRA